MTTIPRDTAFDSSAAFLQNGYNFIADRCRDYGSNIFQTRIMLRRVYCVTGEEAARMFYVPGRFTRNHAMPPTTLSLLQDKGSSLTLDGEEHARRKEMFMALMGPARLEQLVAIFEEEWQARLARWQTMPEVVLQTEAEYILCRSACRWVGITLDEGQAAQRATELAAMIEGAGSIGPRNWKGQLLRQRTEHWAQELIRQARSHRRADPATPLDIIAHHTALHGHGVDYRTAAVELLNLLRPIVAVARYITYSALALHHHPEYQQRLRAGEAGLADLFVNEVRRYYPFFPAVGGVALEDFAWRGHQFHRGDWMLLDLHGTNHDPRLWQQPERFYPERFLEWDRSPYNFIPQGGGEYSHGHRCAGEWLTVEVMRSALRLLTQRMSYKLPPQDLSIRLSRMPAMVGSRLVLSEVHGEKSP
ncbi:fatty acid alpha hydroxylase [Pseudomonas saudimassiliensis]|uniref:Fatty acid alpha hydroxylase n=1 Tax=Pseudomonas saudimassiliensis TaxID=1461581 RepID=A0A078M6N0_9PSED|nr:cytochrome P450 [Pseudomonas saudimassiliensis]CEA01934.1 fatty acid alpha hydroxylase [Pseudomonas saudimassiliensis]CEF25673.1 fatty acid alpha hydroxylase [Pseudomonas saudimassiliensis]